MHVGEQRLVQGFGGISEGWRPVGRTKRRWKDNVKVDFQEVTSGDMDWIHLSQDRDGWRAVVNAVMNLEFHKMR
jgi:hypothetical protein